MISDNVTTINDLKELVKKFVEDREWQQFHSPKNLSMALASEVAELMDLFLWCDNKESYDAFEKRRQEAEDEISDIAFIILAFCVRHKIDLTKAIFRKQIKRTANYPIEKCKGKSLKYTQL